MKFYEIFARLCTEKGEAPNAVCEKLGLSNSTYSFWKKNNSKPRETTLIKIAEYFNVSVSYLTESGDDEEYINRVMGLVVEWLLDNDYEYSEENGSVKIGKDDDYIHLAMGDFAEECMAIKKVSEDGFELAMEDWERRNFVQNINNNFNSNNVTDSENVINNSPNATLTVKDDDAGLSKQEEELIDLYRNFSLEQQVKLLTYAFKLKEE